MHAKLSASAACAQQAVFLWQKIMYIIPSTEIKNHYMAGMLLNILDVEAVSESTDDELYVFIEEVDKKTGESIKRKILL